MDARISGRLHRLSRQQCGLNDRFISADASVIIGRNRRYIDFYSGAGRFNYGHRNPVLMRRLANDIRRNGDLSHGARSASIRAAFVDAVHQVLLAPRAWSYDMQLCGPSQAGALECALGLARRITGRQNIVSFTEGFHGASGRALVASARQFFRQCADRPDLANITFMPYDRCFGPDVDTMAHLERLLESTHDASQLPAAVVVETVLDQGGVSVLTWRWLKDLQALCRRYDMLLVFDETQVGCGRTGRFFSFEVADIHADMIVLAKSLSGLGLPMSLVLSDRSLPQAPKGSGVWASSSMDQDLALLTATHALDVYWVDASFSDQVARKEGLVRDWLENVVHSYPEYGFSVRGRGLVQGLDLSALDGLAHRVASRALQNGLLIDTSGTRDEVLKLLPALTIDNDLLIRGLEILEASLADVLRQQAVQARGQRPDGGAQRAPD